MKKLSSTSSAISESQLVTMVQSHGQEEMFSLMISSVIILNNGAHTLTDCKIIKSQFNKNHTATIKNK